jgi:hypothetical protein
MSTGKTIGAMIAGFVLQSAGGYLLHDVLLMQEYNATASLWRAPAAINHNMWAVVLANAIFAIGAVLIYIKGVEQKSWIGQGIRFGILLALVTTVFASLTSWATMPMPHRLAFHWVIGEGVLCILLGLLIAVIAQPKAA